jgi:NADH pyrophosphatase NudC (nudix superfamily)
MGETTKAVYQNFLRTCAMCAQLLATQEQDIPDLLRSIDRADAIAPLMDPTLWMKKRDAMLMDKELLEAALPLVRWYAKYSTKCDGCGKPSVGRSADDVPLCAECGTAMDAAAKP